jgi:hypothetical protein
MKNIRDLYMGITDFEKGYQEGLKLNCTHQLLVYADDVNILGGTVHTIQKNAEALVIARKENGLELRIKTNKMHLSFLLYSNNLSTTCFA